MSFAHPDHRFRNAHSAGVRPLSSLYTDRAISGHPAPVCASPHRASLASGSPMHATPVAEPTTTTPHPPYGVMQRSTVERQAVLEKNVLEQAEPTGHPEERNFFEPTRVMNHDTSFLDSARYADLTKDLRVRRTQIWAAARHGDISRLAWITSPEFVDVDGIDAERHYALHMASLVALSSDAVPTSSSVVGHRATPPSFKARRRRINGWDRPWRETKGGTTNDANNKTVHSERTWTPGFLEQQLAGRRPVPDVRGIHTVGGTTMLTHGSDTTADETLDAQHVLELEKIHAAYEVVLELGRGSYGAAFWVRDRNSGTAHVMKTVAVVPGEDQRSLHEAQLMQSFSHDHIVSVQCTFESPRAFWIVEEWCRGGELFDHLIGHRYTEQVVGIIAHQLLGALNHLHERGIVHRNIGPASILVVDHAALLGDLSQLAVKLCDFSLATALPVIDAAERPDVALVSTDSIPEPELESAAQTSACTAAVSVPGGQHSRKGQGMATGLNSEQKADSIACHEEKVAQNLRRSKLKLEGSAGEISSKFERPNYVAPEVWIHSSYGAEADIWSIGMLIYQLLVGTTPFDTTSLQVMQHQITTFDAEQALTHPDIPGAVTRAARDLLTHMLESQPEERWSASEGAEHGWVQNAINPTHSDHFPLISLAAHATLAEEHRKTVRRRPAHLKIRKSAASTLNTKGWHGYYMKSAHRDPRAPSQSSLACGTDKLVGAAQVDYLEVQAGKHTNDADCDGAGVDISSGKSPMGLEMRMLEVSEGDDSSFDGRYPSPSGSSDRASAVHRFQSILQRYGGTANLWEACKLRLLDAFRILDKNGDGYISVRELRCGLASLSDLGLSNTDIRELAQLADFRKEGCIHYSTFVRHFRPPPGSADYSPTRQISHKLHARIPQSSSSWTMHQQSSMMASKEPQSNVVASDGLVHPGQLSHYEKTRITTPKTPAQTFGIFG